MESQILNENFTTAITESVSPRTYFIFLDLPVHVEYRVAGMPLLEEGQAIEFNMTITQTKKKLSIVGTYVCKRRLLKFGGRYPGLTVYYEWSKE